MSDTTADAAGETVDNAKQTGQAARRTASSAKRTVGAAVSSATDSGAGGGASQLRQSVDEIRAEVGREVGARAQQARDWAEDRADQLRTTVTEKPFASAGAAFAAGVILGVLLARR